MRIAHITDIHIARAPALNDYNAKRILGYVNYRLFRSRLYKERIARMAIASCMDNPPDLVLLTGDITQHGLDNEFEAALDVLSPFVDGGIPVLAVPGNHDIYGHCENPALASLISRLAHPLVTDEYGLYRLPGIEVLPLFQGIPTPPFFSHGKQSSDELERAKEAWKEPPHGVMRLVIGHYPVIDTHGGRLLYFRGLREAEMLVQFCSNHHVAGYFCGHNHKRFAAPMPGGCTQYAAPALSSVRHAGEEWISVYECGPGEAHPCELRRATENVLKTRE